MNIVYNGILEKYYHSIKHQWVYCTYLRNWRSR